MNKVHYRDPKGKLLCNPGKQWASCVLTSSASLLVVTCSNCLRIAAKPTKS